MKKRNQGKENRMRGKEERFLKKAFCSYYEKNYIDSVPMIESREFGVGEFGKKIVKRHLSFSNQKKLNEFLRKKVPPFISYSAAYYNKPTARPMQEKEFRGADLIYEFDADDIPTDCKQEHDSWKCSNKECGETGKGNVKACPKCGSGVEVKEWFCEKCLNEAKKQTLRLIEVLSSELGFEKGISVNFSGKAGYHVHVRNNKAKDLSKQARAELIDYLSLNGFDLESHGFGVMEGSSKSSAMLKCPIPSKAKGITKRFMEKLVLFIKEGSIEQIAAYGSISRKQARFFVENREKILKKMREGILFPVKGSRPKTSQKFWKLLIGKALSEESIKLNIDRQTSVDIHKIIRVPESIHAGTGLIAKSVPVNELKDFNPFVDAVAFSDSKPVKVFINKAPSFSLGGKNYKAFNQTLEELPFNAAVYLIALGKAELR